MRRGQSQIYDPINSLTSFCRTLHIANTPEGNWEKWGQKVRMSSDDENRWAIQRILQLTSDISQPEMSKLDSGPSLACDKEKNAAWIGQQKRELRAFQGKRLTMKSICCSFFLASSLWRRKSGMVPELGFSRLEPLLMPESTEFFVSRDRFVRTEDFLLDAVPMKVAAEE